jgi:hypothetical protein
LQEWISLSNIASNVKPEIQWEIHFEQNISTMVCLIWENVEQKNPTQKHMPGIIPNDIEIPISIIVKYVSMGPFLYKIF